MHSPLRTKCLSCGSDLSAYTKTPENGHPCPFCGRIDGAALPASIRQWLTVRLRTVHDVDDLRLAQEELATFMKTRECDARTTFLATLVLEETVLDIMKRRSGN